MRAKEITPSQWILLAISLFCVFGTHILAPPAGLSQMGLMVLGILIAAILLFLSWGTGWTSMFIIFSLMLVPGLSPAKVTQSTFGNNTAVFLLFCFMLSACLTKSGVAKRIAIWFITNKLARKSPWGMIAMYFAATYVLNFFLSSAVCIMIMLPILDEIFTSVKLKREAKTPLASAMLLGSVAVALLANGANPISHAIVLQGFSFYESYTGEAMSFFSYCAICTPITLLASFCVYFVTRFLWRPNVSALSSVNYDELKGLCGPMKKKEKWSIFIYIICVIFWLMPGMSAQFWPSIAGFFGKINNCLPPLFALFFMNFVKVDGEPILSWDCAVKSVNWPSYMFIATIMGLGSFIGSADVGVSQWLSAVMSPVFANVSPMIFIAIMVLIVNALTNFCSNSVALSVVFAMAMPLVLSVYNGRIEPMLLAVLITNAALNGWATAPASPTAAVAYADGWGDQKLILGWGLLLMLVDTVICLVFGGLMGNLLF